MFQVLLSSCRSAITCLKTRHSVQNKTVCSVRNLVHSQQTDGSEDDKGDLGSVRALRLVMGQFGALATCSPFDTLTSGQRESFTVLGYAYQWNAHTHIGFHDF